MTGMNAQTGQTLDGIAHIRQSVQDILTTRIGTRVMRREYGSMLPELIDHPLNESTLLRAYSASIIAIMRWEPRIRVQSIRKSISTNAPGSATLSLDAITTGGQAVDIAVPLGSTGQGAT